MQAFSPADTTFAVQGYGNVGSWAARIMQQLGARDVRFRGAARQADQALYQAKASGRNAVVSFSRGFTAGQVKNA